MNAKEYVSQIGSLNGFTLNKPNNGRLWCHSAEYYRYDQYTVQIGATGAQFNEPTGFYVELYFDSASQDHCNKVWRFSIDELGKAIQKALAVKRAMAGDIESEAYASAEF